MARSLDASTSLPRVIGHRGACGLLPEHTLASYQSAMDAGVDAVELDLVATRDGRLIALHDPELSATTDIAAHPVFAGRRAQRMVDDQPIQGWFARDFTLEEIKTLRARQRLSFRDHSHDGRYEIPTLEEALDLVAKTDSMDRKVEVYLELKNARWHAAAGLPLDQLLLDMLRRRNLVSRECGICIEAFEPDILRSLRPQLDARIVQLIESPELTSREALTEIKTYADGIGVWKRLIVPTREQAADEADESHLHLAPSTTLVSDAHAIGLSVDAWTFRDEPRFLAADYAGSPAAEYAHFAELGVDAVIADFPATTIAARRER
jgi:glycerophosphoryl diester phosphodiesterase